ncbi:hypothetical protein BJF78_21580 [Pseudonocardia sp. CNS-139]|nr:hypothetical protein BJF78_21580 [Pseudonocardia sp. CNS-139]
MPAVGQLVLGVEHLGGGLPVAGGRPSPESIALRPSSARMPAAAIPRAIPSTCRPPGSATSVQPLRICSIAQTRAESSASASSSASS